MLDFALRKNAQFSDLICAADSAGTDPIKAFILKGFGIV
jgi:hypothetical protein